MSIRDLSIATIDAQCAKGLAKYGKPLDAADFTAPEIAQHLVEELADGLQYGVKLLQLARAQQDTITALREENQGLREENHRLKSALAPILELAQSFTVEVPAAPTPAPAVPAAYTDRCEACGAEVCQCEPLIQPVPVPSPAAASLPQIPNGEIPEGCITSVQAQEIMGVGRSTFSNHKQAGRVVPAGKVRLKGGQWSDFYRRADIEQAVEKLKERTAALELKPVKPGPITVYNSTSLGQLLGLSVSGVSFAVKAGRLTPREGTGTGSGNPYLFDITDPVAFKANYEAKTHASRAESAQKAGKARADQARQRREHPPAIIKEAPMPLSPAFTPTPQQEAARAFKVHDIVPAPPVRLPAPKVEIPESELDLNEAGRYDAEERGKRDYPGGFWLLRRFVEGKAQYYPRVSATDWQEMGWEPIERFSKNGLGRWESCPADPGAVGMHNGITTGPKKVLTPGDSRV